MNIDRIARGMVDVEPSADLEARIRASVRRSEARPTRTATWWLWRVGAPLAACGAIALAIVVQGPESRVQESQGLPTEQLPSSQVAQSPIPNPQSPIANFQSAVSKTKSPIRKAPASRLSAEELAWMERRIPALDPMNGLQVDRLRMDSIQPEPLTITPLTMTPVGTEGAGIERRIDR